MSVNAELAGARRDGDGYSLSPASLTNISAGTRLALPSPNGSALSLATGTTPNVEIASELDVSGCAPTLVDGAYVAK